jgi:Asp-tRNA(Asn)/Glu-tRNA(Gln) amidotransferase A subunit family amidase
MSARGIVPNVALLAVVLCSATAQAAGSFKLEEATIDDIHQAIRAGEVTCSEIVQGYIARARAYNGVCTKLVTPGGSKVAKAIGTLRAGAPLKFPTDTVAISSILPDFDKYKGLAPDYGRMEPTMSDPAVQQQYGMVVGIPNAKQVNALETLNIRGERSVSCKKECDAATGPLPGHCPASCDAFRHYPDALERAAELDKQYGRNPDTKAMPLYCVPMAFKAVYDAKDMRSTGGGDVNYAMDVAPADSTLTSRMRAAGAIIYAQAHNSEYNGGSGDPGGAAKVEHPAIGALGARETWGGTSCNPYDTERETGGSSGGPGASVAANLEVCAICETTGGSCRNPANLNGVVNLVPTKGTISYGGGIGANPYQDRPGILCRTVKDAVTVLDAFRDSKTGTYFDARDPYTALTHLTASKTPYLNSLSEPGKPKPLAGMRIGVIREFMIKPTSSDAPVSDGVNRELQVLRDLGAELVEMPDPDYPDDRSIPNMTFTFEDALAEVIPFHMPEVLSWKKDGKPEFEVPGWDVTSRKYLVAAASHKAPWPTNLNMRRIIQNPPSSPDEVTGYQFSFNFAQYLLLRGDSRVYDWQTLNANAKYHTDVRRAAMKNWEDKDIDIRTDAVTFTMKRRDVVRMAVMKVLEQNKVDVLVNPSATTMAAKLGGASEPERGRSYGYGAVLGIPEVFVPAGFSDVVYEPTFVLSADGTKYDTVTGKVPTKLASPLPFNIGFWAAPGDEAKVIKVASAYEAATHHRRPPPAFGPVKGEPRGDSAHQM